MLASLTIFTVLAAKQGKLDVATVKEGYDRVCAKGPP